MKLYGHFMSSPANQARYVASALGVAHDYEHVDLMQGQQKTPEFLSVNPVGKVPALEDGAYKLSESNAISRYLASKNDGKLYSRDLQESAKIDQWMDFATQHVRMSVGKVLFNKMFAPMMDMPSDENAIAEGRNHLDAQLPIINEALGRNPYLTGSEFTIADIAMVAAMDPFEVIEYDASAFPNVDKWRKSMMAQDWYQNVHSHYAAEMQG